MSQRLNIAVLFGGQSTEHEVSIVSACNVIAALDTERYHVLPIYITEQGSWHYFENFNIDPDAIPKPLQLIQQGHGQRLLLIPGQGKQSLAKLDDPQQSLTVDCIMPILHGTLGEDGAPQGLFEMLDLPYVGSDILSSAVCMAKHVVKRLVRAAGMATADWLLLTAENKAEYDFDKVTQQLGLPLFIKPTDLGSAVGVSKVYDADQYHDAIECALHLSQTVLLERYIEGREIESAVLGNHVAEATVPGEIITHGDFYSYAAKYIEPEGVGATLDAPAKLDADMVERVKQTALQVYRLLGCQGMARVDFFITADNDLLLNEVNTIPGFTNISMYPRLWQLSGLNYPELLDKLIDLALDAYERKQSLNRLYQPQSSSTLDSSMA